MSLPSISRAYRKLGRSAKHHAPTIAIAAALLLAPALAHAATSTGLPWEDPLTKFKNSITGPVALVISTVGVAGCGMGLVFGGEMNEFLRRGMILVMVISMIVMAASVISTFFTQSGAVVAMTFATTALA